jgi:putative hydrolase
MKYIIDTHTHTVASGHAYSTLIENAKAASAKGLKALAVTDHGVAMPGGPHMFYFGNLKVIPEEIEGVRIFKGIEANIMDYEGKLDMPDRILKRLDVVIASLHDACIKPGTKEENTRAILKVMDNKNVDIIGHPGNPAFEIDIDAVVKRAKEKDVLIEINNSSFRTSRIGSYDNCYKIAKKAKEVGATMVIGSDAHICYDIGNFEKAHELIQKLQIPDDLILNLWPEKLKRFCKL